ncbi:MAG: Hsp20/alpha crystallin family protein [Candidatus Verstraetearchaeota archaeon]|nr:Hsp20/alpha crystallin family protein [Candidatus Verstraetearchaeota archaeon]
MSINKKSGRERTDFWITEVMWDSTRGCLEPLTEVYDNENELIIRIDMPCVRRKSDIKVHLTDDTVSIEAQMNRVIQYERWGTFQREAKFFRYTKTFTLPAKIDPESSKARFKDGILELRLPKKERRFTIPIE